VDQAAIAAVDGLAGGRLRRRAGGRCRAVQLGRPGLLGIAFGFILRNTAGAIVTLFGIMLVLPALGIVLPASVGRHILPYLPSNAGQAVMQVHPNGNMLAPWTGFALYVGYTAVAVVAAALLLRRRDA
jgi:ABC-2 type transport system permease protein